MRCHHELFLALGAALLSLGACATATPEARRELRYQRIVLSPDPVEQPLLTGPPQTAGMRSGKVVLKPGEHMHRHSTSGNEELLVFLQGKARVVLGAETVPMEAGQVLYIPPQVEHEVHNDGMEELRYIYTVAPARP
jgi:mannose-6-phosphate isomerase-like protein (cupin superfamily)